LRDRKEFDKAIADLNEVIRIDSKNVYAYVIRGNTWEQLKQYEKAIADYNEAIRLDPKSADCDNNRAWLMATCPDAKHRDGRQAVESARRACELTEWRIATLFDTLSAAYAEAGSFDEAVRSQSHAIGLLTDEAKKANYRTRLKLYQEKKPYRTASP
jgi:tetratricopeptide (TPR) repeat protein